MELDFKLRLESKSKQLKKFGKRNIFWFHNSKLPEVTEFFRNALNLYN